MSDFELLRDLRRLAREREPQRDLWPDIRARIDSAAPSRRRGRPLAPWLLALAAVLVLAVLVAMPRGPMQQAGPTTAGAPADASTLLLAEADALTLEYLLALDQLGGHLQPPGLAPVLQELDASAVQIRSAIRDQPEADYLIDQLRRTYAQRLRLTRMAVVG